MARALFILSALLLSSHSFGAMVTAHDSERGCTLYQAVKENEDGQVVLEAGQRLLSSKRVYGLSFLDLEIDFDKHEARVQTMMNVILGLNRMLIPQKTIIRADHPEFTQLINQVNRRIALFEKICVTSENELVYASFFPAEE